MERYSLPLENLKQSAKEIIISQLKTGDLLKVKSEKLPIIYHYGVVVKTDTDFLIVHNDPDKFNKKGGNIIEECFLNWIKGREIVEVTHTGADYEEIKTIVKTFEKCKYDLVAFNCEDFVNLMSKSKKVAPQLLNWTIILSSVMIAYFIIKKK